MRATLPDPDVRARAGAAFLDAKRPGWANLVKGKLALLDMEHNDRCILALLWGSYENGLKELKLLTIHENLVDRRALEYGFCHFDPDELQWDRSIQYQRLTEGWLEEVERRTKPLH